MGWMLNKTLKGPIFYLLTNKPEEEKSQQSVTLCYCQLLAKCTYSKTFCIVQKGAVTNEIDLTFQIRPKTSHLYQFIFSIHVLSLTKHSATSNLIVLSVVCFCDPVDKLGLYNGKSIPRWLLKMSSKQRKLLNFFTAMCNRKKSNSNHF